MPAQQQPPLGKPGATLDVKVRIPELDDVKPFWLRRCAAHHTFSDLYDECVNHSEVLRSRTSLTRVRASRHFWCGERMMLRHEPLSAALDSAGGARTAPAGYAEISLVLRPDYYHAAPRQYLQPNVEYTYLDAEVPVGKVIAQLLSREERTCCFDLCTDAGRRLDRTKSLAAQGLSPAWWDTAGTEFPARARLRLRPRPSWLAVALLVAAVLGGVAIGFYGFSFLNSLRS